MVFGANELVDRIKILRNLTFSGIKKNLEKATNIALENGTGLGITDDDNAWCLLSLITFFKLKNGSGVKVPAMDSLSHGH